MRQTKQRGRTYFVRCRTCFVAALTMYVVADTDRPDDRKMEKKDPHSVPHRWVLVHEHGNGYGGTS